jgi:hypothetical protein
MRVSNLAVELPLDTLAGPTFDGVDLITGSGEFEANTMAFDLWAMLLNHGYRVAGTASSDACFDRPSGGVPGVVRLYTFVGRDFSLSKVTRSATQGRNFVTSGPLLLVSVEDRPPGSTFSAGLKPRTLLVEAWPSGADPKGLSRVELCRNGHVVSTTVFPQPLGLFRTNFTVIENEEAWYCVKIFGSDPQRQRAISGAFFFDAKDHRPPMAQPIQLQVTLQDVSSGKPLHGSVTELRFHGTLPISGPRHSVSVAGRTLTVPATVRLRAEAPDYQPATLSPFLDNPGLVGLVTSLSAEDLLKWETFEQIRSLMRTTALTFRLEKKPH